VVTVRDPLLIIAFNRPDHFSQLIERLRETKPARIYIAVDGPRVGSSTDSAAVSATRKLVGSIEWTTDVHTLFQQSNLGCGLGVSTALDWFFSNEERGIILEDDIFPRESFFEFCSELLDRHAGDPNVLAISGCNFVPPEFVTGRSAYRFSRVPHIWGWATWRDKWALHELDISNWQEQMPLRKLWEASGRSPGGLVFWRSIFNLMAVEKIDTWDMQLVFAGMARDMYTATSNVNLIDNIGFGEDATHTEVQPPYLRQSENILIPTSPVSVKVDEKADAWSRKVVFGATTKGLIGQGLRYLKHKTPSPKWSEQK
jgi:hypothetical protein